MHLPGKSGSLPPSHQDAAVGTCSGFGSARDVAQPGPGHPTCKRSRGVSTRRTPSVIGGAGWKLSSRADAQTIFTH